MNQTKNAVMRVYLALVFFLLPCRANAQLSELERQMSAFIDARNAEALALLERTVNINSGTMNFEGVREVGRVFQDELDELGFTTRWVDGSGWERAGHLLAEREGSGVHLLLIGHLDTVFEGDSPFQKYELRSDSTASGPGVIDMKGGNVIIIQALRALRSAGVLDDMQVTVVLHGDEEKSGRPLALARQHIIEAARAADVALGFEDGDGDPRTAVTARRGWTGWELHVTGKPAHSSQIFQDEYGAGAVFETARILTAFYDSLSAESYLTFNPGLALAGTQIEFDAEGDRGTAFGKLNVIPEHALVAGDIRALSGDQLNGVKSRMSAITNRNLPHTSASITFEDTYPPMAPTEGNRNLMKLYSDVSCDLGLGQVTAVDPRNAGAADISFAADHVEMALDGLGLMGEGGHTIDETADLRTLPTQAKRAAVLMYRLMKQK